MEIKVVKNILDANERIAADNRKLFDEKGVFVVNLMGAPGCGKTSLVEHTIKKLKDKLKISVVEGDIESSIDAERVGKLGVTAVQINTGGACHIDGNMLKEALPSLDLEKTDLLIVENVGNLVCPAEFKLGENFKMMILSVAEGDDKPKKYPLMFHESRVLLINKVDLLPHVDCSVEKIRKDSLSINPKLKIFEISCRTGKGIDEWTMWLEKEVKKDRNEQGDIT
jgi:hydrogenase nickel incorporation protein HypB